MNIIYLYFNIISVFASLTFFWFINWFINKSEKSERSEDTDDIEIKIDNIHVKYP